MQGQIKEEELDSSQSSDEELKTEDSVEKTPKADNHRQLSAQSKSLCKSKSQRSLSHLHIETIQSLSSSQQSKRSQSSDNNLAELKAKVAARD